VLPVVESGVSELRARLTGDTVPASLLRAGIAALIAAFLIAIKALLH